MRDSFAAIRLRFDGDGFLLDARLHFSFDRRVPASERETLRLEAEKGIRETWSFSLPLDEETERSIRAYLQAREPWSLPVFERYLDEENRRAEREAVQKAAALLRESLASLEVRKKAAELPPPPRAEGARIRMRAVCGSESSAYPCFHYIKSLLQGSRRPLLIRFKPYRFMPAHVNSGFFRRFWGIFRSGTVISLGFNWSPRFPGRIFLPTRYMPSLLRKVAAHEFGHCMGLGDAYAAWYRCYEEAPGSRSYLMNSNGRVSAEELRMLLAARVSEKMVHFPFRCSWQKFRRGLQRETARMSKEISRRDRSRT